MKRLAYLSLVIMLVASFTLVAIPQALAASTWYVDINACPGPGTGTEIDPFCEIQGAIDAASDGDTILVAEGTYEETIEWYTNLTIIGAGTENTIIDAGESGTVITVDGVDNSRLEGFTITHGDAPYGGGMDIGDVGELIVEDCVFEWNDAYGGGGVNYGSGGDSPTFINCHFINNTAECSGGGMRANGHATLIDCVFEDNSAGQYGGGLKTGCDGDLDVINCIFTNNEANWGGAIAVRGGCARANITGCLFENNTAYDAGGGVYTSYSLSSECEGATITSSVFWSNVAGGIGGGMYASTPAIVTNCTFVQNRADGMGYLGPYFGGGLYDSSLGSTVTNCIFWDNVGADENDQIYPPAGGSAPPTSTPLPTMRASAPQSHSIPSEFPMESGGTSITYCNVMGGYEGTGNISGSPMFVDPGCGNFHLQKNSPCIDKGKDNAPGLPSGDYEGQERIMGGGVDIGADEFEQYGGGGGPTVGGRVMMIDKVQLIKHILALPLKIMFSAL